MATPDGILSTYVDDSSGQRRSSYGYMQGTSMAVPHVAGILALMKALNPSLDATMVKSDSKLRLLTTGDASCLRNDQVGYGQINALLAVQQALMSNRVRCWAWSPLRRC